MSHKADSTKRLIPLLDKVYELYGISKTHYPFVIDYCGKWKTPNEHTIEGSDKVCKITPAKIWERRRNLKNMTINAIYDSWNPFSIVDSKGHIEGGIFFTIFEELAAALNFTPK